MRLTVLNETLAVCKLKDLAGVDLTLPFFCLARTAEEISLVCPASTIPENCPDAESGWRGMKVKGPLDFSLTGILAELSGVLAEASIPIFAISTYDTDYILVKEEHLSKALTVLRSAGHQLTGLAPAML